MGLSVLELKEEGMMILVRKIPSHTIIPFLSIKPVPISSSQRIKLTSHRHSLFTLSDYVSLLL